MLENHSFDNLLGWVPGIGRLDRSMGQKNHAGKFFPAGRVRHPGCINRADPHHDFDDVIMQLYGPEGITPTEPPKGAGFLINNCEQKRVTGPRRYMECYQPDQVPVLATLARNYTTCARWFSAIPGPTGPNRLFAHCASSGDYCGGQYEFDAKDPGSFAPPMKSIFNSLADAGESWSIYWDDTYSTARALTQLQSSLDRFLPLKEFTADVKRLGSALPNYIFITPSLKGLEGSPPNTMHPGFGGTVSDGEALVKQVYEALSADEDVWRETLLLVVFDEHGGYWDSINPPARLPAEAKLGPQLPWDRPSDNKPFSYMHYGVRVPAIVVSAWHPPLVDESTVFEHSAIPATIKSVFGLPEFLSARDACSPTFDKHWTLRESPSAPIKLPTP